MMDVSEQWEQLRAQDEEGRAPAASRHRAGRASPLSRAALVFAVPVLIAGALLLLSACEGPEVIARTDLGLADTTMSCTHTSFCMTCLPGFDGKMKCGLKLSPYCPGSKPARGHLIEETLRYPSKPDKHFTRQHFEGLEPTGNCA